MSVYFLGGGNMASAIVAGLCNAGWREQIFVANRGEERQKFLQQQFGIRTGSQLPELTADDVLFLAVKPQDMQAACKNVVSNGALIVSMAAGLTIATLSQYFNGATRIIRIMPNTPSQVGLGISALFAHPSVSEADKTLVRKMMESCGSVITLENEAEIHHIIGVSGSGSAYIFYLMNALQQAALDFGFDETQARTLSLQTFKGAVALAEQSGEPFQVLQDKVTSKGGTTFAALEYFRQHNLAQILQDGANAAAKRSEEMESNFLNP